MPYDARVFQILIASPGDVQEERKILADVIYEWNSVNSRDRRVVLLPLRWETHSAPEMGLSAQTIINSQVVDQCDMAIGVFWTRMGTPTSEAESGTAEEIERVGKAGKHVMLYFSKAKVDIDQLDIAEYGRLKEFKAKTYPQGLIESYSSTIEFREKLTRQLAIKLLTLIAEHSREQAHEALDISERLALVLDSSAEVLPSPALIQIPRIICTNADEIPPFTEKPGDEEDQSAVRIGLSRRPNPHYYKEVVKFFALQSAYRPLRLGVRNLANQGIRDVYLAMRVETLAGRFRVKPAIPPLRFPQRWTGPEDGSSGILVGNVSFPEGSIIASGGGVAIGTVIQGKYSQEATLQFSENASGETLIEMELPVVQAHRTIVSTNELMIETDGMPATGIISATVYSSDIPPFSLQMKVEIQVTEQLSTYQQIVEEAQKLADDEGRSGERRISLLEESCMHFRRVP